MKENLRLSEATGLERLEQSLCRHEVIKEEVGVQLERH